MNTKSVVLLGVLIIAVAVGWLFFGKKETPQEISLTPQTSSEGSVDVEVTPTDISESSTEWRFDIVLNTHSVELDQDMTKVAFLKDDKGVEYKPFSWEGAAAGGHHREGSLSFAPIRPRPKTLTLVLKDIGDVLERKFEWVIAKEGD